MNLRTLFKVLTPIFICLSFNNVFANEAKSAEQNVLIQGGNAWSGADLDETGQLYIACGAVARDEYQGVKASTQVRALDSKGNEVWKSEIYEIPAVCGRLNNTCPKHSFMDYFTQIPNTLLKSIDHLDIFIFGG